MVCPICGEDTAVVGSRGAPDAVYRCRKCKSCGHTSFTTESDSDGEEYKRLTQKAQRLSKTRKRATE